MNPYIDVTYDGLVVSDQAVKLVATCKMDIHKFPFDTQSCNVTIGSAVFCCERPGASCPPQALASFTLSRSCSPPQTKSCGSSPSPTRLGPPSFPGRC